MNINLFIQMTQLLGDTYGHLEGNCKIDIEQKKLWLVSGYKQQENDVKLPRLRQIGDHEEQFGESSCSPTKLVK